MKHSDVQRGNDHNHSNRTLVSSVSIIAIDIFESGSTHQWHEVSSTYIEIECFSVVLYKKITEIHNPIHDHDLTVES